MAHRDDDRPARGPGAAAQTPPAPSSWRWSAAFRAVSGFAPDSVVAGRFRIVRLLGSGGMGEVYEAEDLELKERVALKAVRPEIAEDEGVVERFRREIQLARRVTHSSVCRSFDVFRHTLTAPLGWEGPTPEVTFLSMELLEGETLAERIRSKGPFTTAEARPIVEQMASALAAAHDAGVVHRDFKSSNVVLVEPKKADKGVRAVVTDFGLARGGGTSAGRDQATLTGGFAGTPAYMAPEQVEGGEITPATDVYALGVVLYEMVTGKWPFEGDTPLAIAIRRLNEPPASPRKHAADLDPKWEVAILRCLERDPADRFESTLDVLKALAGEEVAPGPKHKRRVRQRIGVAAAALALVLSIAGLWLSRSSRPPAVEPPRPPSSGVASRRAVAVLGFKNLSGREDAAWLTKALSEMLTMELAAGEALRMIPGENVARMKVDLSLPETDALAPDTLGKIRTNLGTDLVVLGSYFATGKDTGGKLRLDLRVQDTASGETAAMVTHNGTEAELLDLVSRAGSELRQKLGAGGKPAGGEAAGAHASLPSTPEAARLYAEGLAKLRLFDAIAARDLLEKAAVADPRYPLSHSALAEAWSALGYDAKAREEGKKAVDLSAQLSREERLLVEGRYHEAAKEWDKAIETYRTLWGFFPDTLGYGLRLAEAEIAGGRGIEALATVEALRKLPRPMSEDPRIDLAEAQAALLLGDQSRARAAAVKAAEKGSAQGARLVVARARLEESLALRYTGERERSVAAADEAQRIYAAAGDRVGVARALIEIANGLMYQGELEGARKKAEEALAISREVGDRSGVARALNRMASVLREEGRLAEARKMYEEARTIAKEIGERYREATAINNVGDILRSQGELPASRRMYDEALAAFRESGDRRGITFALFNLGYLLVDQGDLPGARKTFEESLAEARGIGEKSLFASASLGFARVLLAEGDLAGARKQCEEALAIRTQTGEKGYAAEIRLSLAEISTEDGRFAEAEAFAREALQEFERQKASPKEALAQAILAEILLAQEKLSEARSALDRARALSDNGQLRPLRLRVALAAARERVSSSQPSEAVKNLSLALAEATRLGLVVVQLETRLALGQIEARFGDPSVGRRSLAALERDAKAKGFGLIARKARTASS